VARLKRDRWRARRVGASALYMWAAANFTYSTGERAGYVQKFSKKGWVCKMGGSRDGEPTRPSCSP
jgi:hypothetical protein